jgi:hypothetical protein
MRAKMISNGKVLGAGLRVAEGAGLESAKAGSGPFQPSSAMNANRQPASAQAHRLAHTT